MCGFGVVVVFATNKITYLCDSCHVPYDKEMNRVLSVLLKEVRNNRSWVSTMHQ
jgi:hypothetical protein